MSPRITASLAVILAAVVGYIFLVDRPQAQRAEEAKHLVRLASKDVTAINLVSPKNTVGLARRDATHWDITHPIHAPAATFSVNWATAGDGRRNRSTRRRCSALVVISSCLSLASCHRAG